MLKTIRLIGLIAVVHLSVLGCATPATKLNLGEGLAPQEGAVLLVSHCAYREGVKYELFKISGQGPSKIHTHTFSPGSEFAVFKLPAGRYSLRHLIIGSFNLTVAGDGMDFDVLPGRVSYFGDVYIKDSGQNSVAINWVNRLDKAENLIETRYPGMLAQYPLEYVEVN